MSDSTQEAARIRAELSAANDAALRFTASAAQMQSAYTYALNRMNSALSQLSGAFRGLEAVGMNAFSSLISAVTPAVQTLSNLAVKLFGATVWQSGTKAANATASAINSVAKAAKSAASAQRDLYGFDQITRVSASSGSGSSGGGSGSGSSGGSGQAEGSWVRISGLLDSFAERAKSVLSQIWQPFADAWDSQGAGVVEAAQAALANIGSAAAAVGSSWLKAWTGGAGEQAVSSVLSIVQSLLTAVGNVAARFREAWTAGGAGDAIFQDLADIANVFLGALEDMASATAAWAGQLDFSGLVSGFGNLVSACKPLVELLSGGLSWAYTNVLLPLAGWVIQSAGPAALNVLTSAVNLFTSALNLFQPLGLAVWNNLLQPLGRWTGQVITAALGAVSNAFNALAGALNGLPAGWESLKARASSIWTSIKTALTGAANGSKTAVISAFAQINSGVSSRGASLKTSVAGIWSSIKSTLSSVAGSCKTSVISAFTQMTSGATGQGASLKTSVAGIWSSIKSALSSAAGSCKTSVVSAFTQMNSGATSQGNSLKTRLSGIFGTIVTNIKSKLSSVKTALTTPFKNGLNAVIDLVNRMINKVNSALKFSWSAVKVLGKVIVPAGSVTLAKLPTISRLAEGGVTTGPVFSLIGEAGREAVLPLERNTDWMDRLAERLAQAEGRQGDGLVLEVHVGDELLAKQVIRRVNETTRRTGRCPIYV
ncbi:MAG: hypothetical protein LIO51_07370 [Clostridiales bacterium]|nr:hypothetical protein [Clostridiales bacterium]